MSYENNFIDIQSRASKNLEEISDFSHLIAHHSKFNKLSILSNKLDKSHLIIRKVQRNYESKSCRQYYSNIPKIFIPKSKKSSLEKPVLQPKSVQIIDFAEYKKRFENKRNFARKTYKNYRTISTSPTKQQPEEERYFIRRRCSQKYSPNHFINNEKSKSLSKRNLLREYEKAKSILVKQMRIDQDKSNFYKQISPQKNKQIQYEHLKRKGKLHKGRECAKKRK